MWYPIQDEKALSFLLIKKQAELVYTKCPRILVALFELKLNVPLVLKDLQNRNSAYTLKPWSLILSCLAFCGILWTYLFMLIRSLKKNSSLIKSKWSFQAGGCVIAGENAHTGWVCRILLAWLAKE